MVTTYNIFKIVTCYKLRVENETTVSDMHKMRHTKHRFHKNTILWCTNPRNSCRVEGRNLPQSSILIFKHYFCDRCYYLHLSVRLKRTLTETLSPHFANRPPGLHKYKQIQGQNCGKICLGKFSHTGACLHSSCNFLNC